MQTDLLVSETPARFTLPDGRQLAWRGYGAPAGRPVYFFHGFPGCRLQAAMVDAPARALGITLVGFDRPGFGQSTPCPGATIEDVVADVAHLATALGHTRFGVIGISCGAPYALAAARVLRERVSAVGLLGGIGPMDQPQVRAGQLPLLRAMFALARVHPRLVSPLLTLDRVLFRSNPERAVKALAAMLTTPDQAMLARDPQLRALFAASLAEAYRQGIVGALDEVRRIARHRAASLDGVFAPVDVFQSGHDRHVPPAMGRLMARLLPNARLHLCPDDGHLSIAIDRFEACARRVVASFA